MKIGFDGKRAFQNQTGLGNYIRALLNILTQHYPEHTYTLFAPKQTQLFDATAYSNVSVVTPQDFWGRRFPALWRRKGMVRDIAISGVDIFHGVSNELPNGLEKTTARKIVTVHDLIFERYPETYPFDQRYVHRWKIRHACHIADAVIAISRQTRDDLVNLYKIPAHKIEICYQSVNPIFERKVGDEEKERIRRRYGLPPTYFLFVGSISKRKNLITVCKAMEKIKDQLNIPLVVLGNGKKEKEEAKQFMKKNGIDDRLIIINELPQSSELPFTTAADFPAIYQQALALIYPSIFEGFGIPLLEALVGGTPVICSNTSCLPDVAGNAALYFDPLNEQQLAEQILQLANDAVLRDELKRKAEAQVQLFTSKKYADSVMAVYKKVMA